MSPLYILIGLCIGMPVFILSIITDFIVINSKNLKKFWYKPDLYGCGPPPIFIFGVAIGALLIVAWLPAIILTILFFICKYIAKYIDRVMDSYKIEKKDDIPKNTDNDYEWAKPLEIKK